MSRNNTPETDIPAPLLTIEQVADYLGVSTKTVRRRIALREIPYVELSPRVIRFRPGDIETYVAQRVVDVQPLGEVA